MIEKLKGVMQEALKNAEAISSLDDAEDLRIKILGKKGALTEMMKGMKELSPDQRKEFGAAANKARAEIEEKIKAKGPEEDDDAASVELDDEELDIRMLDLDDE